MYSLYSQALCLHQARVLPQGACAGVVASGLGGRAPTSRLDVVLVAFLAAFSFRCGGVAQELVSGCVHRAFGVWQVCVTCCFEVASMRLLADQVLSKGVLSHL